MFIANTLSEASLLRIFYILRLCFNIVCIVVPLIIIIKAMKIMFTYIFESNSDLKILYSIIGKMFIGATIFFIPMIFNAFFVLIDNGASKNLIGYYNRATLEEVQRLETKEKEEEERKRALYLAKQKEQQERDKEEKRKALERVEELNETEQEIKYTPSSSESGSYGVLKVENGVFYIPNSRATKSSDIPKQSGNYGLNPIFWERLNKMITDGNSKGYKISVSNGWRSYESQVSLWNNSSRPCSSRTSWVSCPGGSRHGFGIAADLKYNGKSCDQDHWNCNASAKWVHDNAASYGLTFRLKNEPWHIEPDKVEGGHFGSCQAKC